MKVPSIETASKLVEEAAVLNPGPWIDHNKTAAMCAKCIAEKCEGMDADAAYVMGLLHDIGRREGIMDMRHIFAGYQFMMSLGYEDSARICLTHSYPYKDVHAYNGQNDCSEEETEFIASFINSVEYNDYDRLIQLCDAISFPDGSSGKPCGPTSWAGRRPSGRWHTTHPTCFRRWSSPPLWQPFHSLL